MYAFMSLDGISCDALPLRAYAHVRNATGVICFGTFPMDESHPRGTLAIVTVLGTFFALGWLAMFLFLFLERGAPQP
jgi:Cytochrome c oxidase subunit IIa family